jgi:hypothetical protein
MSYQPPFDGNWMSGRREWAAFEKPPQSIQAAVLFIYAGAAIQALSVIVEILLVHSRLQSFLATASTTQLTPAQQHTAEVYAVAGLVVAGIIGVSVWLWMASRTSAGRAWARVLSTVFFALLSLGMLAVFAEPVTLEGKILPAAEWVVALVAIVLLWQRESSEFFRARAGRY